MITLAADNHMNALCSRPDTVLQLDNCPTCMRSRSRTPAPREPATARPLGCLTASSCGLLANRDDRFLRSQPGVKCRHMLSASCASHNSLHSKAACTWETDRSLAAAAERQPPSLRLDCPVLPAKTPSDTFTLAEVNTSSKAMRSLAKLDQRSAMLKLTSPCATQNLNSCVQARGASSAPLRAATPHQLLHPARNKAENSKCSCFCSRQLTTAQPVHSWFRVRDRLRPGNLKLRRKHRWPAC